jgi:UTP:GlnB (protein PII) uridylyltransferase
LSSAQRALPQVKRVKLLGGLVGVFCGCSIGLLNLFLIDTDRPSTLKLQAMSEEQEFCFEVEATNVLRDDATVLIVRGPDVDGVLASMTSALAGLNLSLVELNAHRGAEHTSKGHDIEDVFVVTRHGTNEKIPDDELDDVALTLLEGACAREVHC